jgi:hypothetical protein
MSAPSTVPTWDTNGTNSTPTTSGHKTDGYAVDEIPISTEMNGWMALVAAWILWLSVLGAANWTWLPPRGDLNSHVVRSSSTGFYSNTSGNEGTISGIPISPKPGEVITNIGIDFTYGTGIDTPECTCKLMRGSLDGSAATALATIQFTGSISPGHLKTTLTLGTPETVLDGVAYWFDIDLNPATTSQVYGVGAVGYQVAQSL